VPVPHAITLSGSRNVLPLSLWHREFDNAGMMSSRRSAAGQEAHVSAVDQLLIFLLEDRRTVPARMAVAGYSEDEIRGAWNYARQAGYTEATGLGADRLTEAGRERALRR